MDITQLLTVATWRAFDVDAQGRVLAGSDESGSVQLVQIDPDGTRTPLTALVGPCTGRWLPGERVVVVEHDTGGDENTQLSLLRLAAPGHTVSGDTAGGEAAGPVLPAGLADLEPLVHADGVKHGLLDVAPGRVVYSTNARNRVDFDVVARDLSTGVDTVLYDGGGLVGAVAVTQDAGVSVVQLFAAAPASSRLLLAVAGQPVRDLTAPGLPALHDHPALSPDGSAVLVSTDSGRDTIGIARIDLASGGLTQLVGDDEHDVAGWPSPDGQLLLVVTCSWWSPTWTASPGWQCTARSTAATCATWRCRAGERRRPGW